MGRPATYSPELADQVCEAIALDTRGLDHICAEHEDFPSGRTVRSWLLKHEEFLPKYTRAREAQAEMMGAEILEIADETSRDTLTVKRGDNEVELADNEWINRSRLRVDTRKWLMSKLAPKKYGDRVQNVVSGPNDGPVEFVTKSILED
jgi:hypothetical protein